MSPFPTPDTTRKGPGSIWGIAAAPSPLPNRQHPEGTARSGRPKPLSRRAQTHRAQQNRGPGRTQDEQLQPSPRGGAALTPRAPPWVGEQPPGSRCRGTQREYSRRATRGARHQQHQQLFIASKNNPPSSSQRGHKFPRKPRRKRGKEIKRAGGSPGSKTLRGPAADSRRDLASVSPRGCHRGFFFCPLPPGTSEGCWGGMPELGTPRGDGDTRGGHPCALPAAHAQLGGHPAPKTPPWGALVPAGHQALGVGPPRAAPSPTPSSLHPPSRIPRRVLGSGTCLHSPAPPGSGPRPTRGSPLRATAQLPGPFGGFGMGNGARIGPRWHQTRPRRRAPSAGALPATGLRPHLVLGGGTGGENLSQRAGGQPGPASSGDVWARITFLQVAPRPPWAPPRSLLGPPNATPLSAPAPVGRSLFP